MVLDLARTLPLNVTAVIYLGTVYVFFFSLLVVTLLISETNCAFVHKWDTHFINKSDVSISHIHYSSLVVQLS